MMKSCRGWYKTSSPCQIRENIIRIKGLLEKWCLNLLAACLFTCGGRRPQVYGQLKVPTDEKIRNIEFEVKTRDFFEL